MWDWNVEALRRAAASLLIGQALWRAWIALRGYFSYDDYSFAANAARSSLTPSYLFREHDGHLMPGGFLLTWLTDKVAPLNYTLVVLIDLGIQALAGWLMFKLLVMIFGPRKSILLPLALFLFTPLTLDAFLWWAAALNYLPLQLGMILAIYGHVKYVRTGEWGWLVGAIAGILFALAFFEKGLLIPIYLVGLTLAVLRGQDGQNGWTLLLRRWPATATYAVLSVAYLAFYRAHVSFGFTYSPDALTVSQLAGRVVGTTFIPGMFGGPWRWLPIGNSGGVAAPPELLRWASWELFVVLVLASVLLRRHAAKAWALLAAYLAADIALLAVGRGSAIGPVSGQAYRFVADAAVPLSLTVAFLLIPQADELAPLTRVGEVIRHVVTRRRWVPVIAGALVINAFAMSAIYTTQRYSELSAGNPSRPYMSNARASLAALPSGTVLLDGPVAGNVLSFLSYPDNLSSHVFAPFRDRPGWGKQTDALWVSDKTGTYVPGEVRGVDAKKGPLANCGYAATHTRVARIPLDLPVYQRDWIVHIGYLAGANTPAVVEIGGTRVDVQLHKGLYDLYFPIRAGGDQVTIQIETPGAGVCVDKITVGRDQPIDADARQ
jgi:hypothetical protein